METAHELLANHPGKLTDATPDPAWREEFFGYFEGLNSDATSYTVSREFRTFEEMIANYGVEATRNKIAAADPIEQAEDDDAFWKRLEPGFETGALAKLVLDQDGAHFAFYNQLQVPE